MRCRPGDKSQGEFPIAAGRKGPEYPRTMSENSLHKAHETRFKNLTAKKAAQGELEPKEEKEFVRIASLLAPASKAKGSK